MASSDASGASLGGNITPLDVPGMGDTADLKSCCAAAYSSDWARLLIGDSFHPGGIALTHRLGEALELRPGVRVLDVASGPGTSAIALAQRFGCEVLGVDYSAESVSVASEAAKAARVDHLVTFQQGDAEGLPVADASFDAVVCECAFCTFPSKAVAASEFARVLAPGGQVGLSDLTRAGEVPAELRTLLAWVACIADARPLAEYERYLTNVGLAITLTEPHDDALADMVKDIRTKLLGAELLVKLKKVNLPNADFDQAHAIAKAAADAVREQRFGYAVLVARKPA